MAYHDELKAALQHRLGSKVRFYNGWTTKHRGDWRGAGHKPVGLVLHHTGGAATDSTDPAHRGNQQGANNGQVRFVSHHPSYGVPCSQFCLDRDGTVYVLTAYPTLHSGAGSFRGKAPWNQLKVPDDQAHYFLAGVEIVSKGVKKDYTAAQQKSLALLIQALSDGVADWHPLWEKNRPRHKDWAGARKVDIKYSNAEVKAWIEQHL